MKKVFLLFVQIIFLTAAFAQHEGHTKTEKRSTPSPSSKVIYTCPMHPEVKSGKPGKCPKCGMSLVKKTVKISTPSPAKKPAAKAVSKPVKKPEEKKDTTHLHHEEMAQEMDVADSIEEDAPYIGNMVIVETGKTVRYDLYITDTTVNFTGKTRHAYAINGTIPGPDLVFTEGDTAEIYLHNNLKDEETSLHWHGVILPNRFDGVPYLTTEPIFPGQVHLYKFAIVQNGTYWYHSHSGLQEQAGIYGALIFNKREGQFATEMDMTGMNMMKHDHELMNMNEMKEMKFSSEESDQHEGHDMISMDDDEKQGMPADSSIGKQPMQHKHEMSDMPGMDHNNPIPAPTMGNGTYNKEYTVVLSEWTDEKPSEVQRRLRTANDWYAIKKGSVQSYSEAIQKGHIATKITNEWKRMNAMDVSDVYYDRFLINGKTSTEAPQFQAGDKVRLRLVNAGGSSYFWVQYGGGKLTVIANDGNEVIPVEVDRLIIGVSETYDVVVTIPENMSYEFRATPEDRTKAASVWLGAGMKMPAPVLPRLNYFEGMKMMNNMMKMNGDMKKMDMQMSLQQMDMNMVMYQELNEAAQPAHTHDHGEMQQVDTSEASNMMEMQGMDMSNNGIVTLNYAMLRAPEKTILPDTTYKELYFTLTGNMNRYVWSINDKIVREWDKILIEKGQNVRIVMFNNSMMRHPMHLHGHDFRVLNRQGEYSPLKNVLDIMPMETDTIEFAGNQDGDWFFHCHILYHMMAGMGNVFSYKNSQPNPELPNKTEAYNKFLRNEQMIHPMAEVSLESNGSDGMAMLSTERYALRTEWRIGIHPEHGVESETYFGRFIGKMQWWYPFIGFDYHHNSTHNEITKNSFGQISNQSNRKAFMAGIEYTLPMLVTAQARVDTKGKFRFQLSREDVPLTPRLRLSAMANTDKEYMTGLKYTVRKWFSLSTHYDSDMGFGAGITLLY